MGFDPVIASRRFGMGRSPDRADPASVAEMLARLDARLENPAANEIRIAAGEQAKITRLRLEKLLAQETS